MLSDGHQRVPPASLHLQLCSSQMLFFRDVKHFRSTFPPGQRAPNVPKPQSAAVNGFAEVNWSSTVRTGTGSGPVAWEQAQREGGRQQRQCRSVRLSPIYHWGRACLLFYLQFLKLKMFLSRGIAHSFLYSEANCFPLFSCQYLLFLRFLIQ